MGKGEKGGGEEMIPSSVSLALRSLDLALLFSIFASFGSEGFGTSSSIRYADIKT